MAPMPKKHLYNTCVNAGVDECVIWGDYYFMEALTRLKKSELGDVLVIWCFCKMRETKQRMG